MAKYTEIFVTLSSSLSSLGEGQSVTAPELAEETGLHKDTVVKWLDWMKTISDLNLSFTVTKKNHIVISRPKPMEIMRLIKSVKN